MTKFERYIYIWDIHWRKEIIKFFDFFNDWKTFFILTWDFFDRWHYSFEVFQKIKKFKEKGILEWVLWNHDVFFIFNFLQKETKLYEAQYLMNWWVETNKSFILNFEPSLDNLEDFNKKMIEVAEWLLSNFNLYYIDELNNLIIHGWIPVFENWLLIWEYFDWKYYEWLDYIKILNKKLKKLDKDTILKFSWKYESKKIINDISIKNNANLKFYDFKDYTNFLPTWYNNLLYYNNPAILKTIKTHLKFHWLNKLIVWHKLAIKNQRNIKNIIHRLDFKVKIGTLFLNNKNKLLKNKYV